MIESNFKNLIEDPFILQSIVEYGFEAPTSIQSKAIPPIKEGKDVIAQSSTGSGKTLAFAIPLLENFKKVNEIQSLIITPTRELCQQITKEFKKLSRYKEVNIIEIFGGVGIEPQIKHVKTAQIVIGTPGRLLDLISRREINLNFVNKLVLDEADRMFDMGFIIAIRKIINLLPKKRQTLLFSATFSPEVMKLAQEYMKEPVVIKAKQYVDKSLLKQYYYVTSIKERFSLLVHLLKNESSQLVVVFCGTRRTVDMIAYNLRKHSFDAKAIHGGLTQSQRLKTLEEFHSNKTHILVASDLAARGLDFKDLTHVYNYDIPKNAMDYLHRIGRTARAGKSGKAVSLLSEKDYDSFRAIQNRNSEPIERLETPPFTTVSFQPFVPTQNVNRFDNRRGNYKKNFNPRKSFHRRGQNNYSR